jgi:hypothetical protein
MSNINYYTHLFSYYYENYIIKNYEKYIITITKIKNKNKTIIKTNIIITDV